MGDRHAAGGMLGIGELGCDVELRTAAIAGAPEARADPFKMRVEFDCGIVEMLCGDRIPVAPEVPIFLLKEGGDQHVLGCEMPIERSEEHTSELQSLMRISYAVFCLK